MKNIEFYEPKKYEDSSKYKKVAEPEFQYGVEVFKTH